MQFLYTVIYTLGFILLSPVFLYRMWKRGKYRANFLQRFGRYDPAVRSRLSHKTGPRCWIQAVSVGEVNVALLLIAVLQRKFPDLRIIVTTTTSTGYTLAYERLPQEVELLYKPPPLMFHEYDHPKTKGGRVAAATASRKSHLRSLIISNTFGIDARKPVDLSRP
jgi:3-deoxy-D-manno-octulosonic-acid transferase